MATGQGKVREILFFFKVRGKVREFCKLVREILNIKKDMEKSGNFTILVVAGILSIFKCLKMLIVFSLALLAQYY